MAQIRSKQIADFAAITNWAAATSSDIAPANDIYNLVSTEASQRVSGDASITVVISDEISTEASLRISGDASVTAAFQAADAAEASARISADNSLNTKIDFIISNIDPAALDSLTEIVSAFQSVDGDLDAAITAVLAEHNAEVSAETSSRISGDLSLELALSVEISNRISAINLEHDHHVSGDASVKTWASDQLSVEISNRQAGDTTLSNALSTEVVNRTSADASLAAAITNEANTRAAGDLMVEETVSGFTGKNFQTTANFLGGTFDLEVYVNGLRVEFVQNGPADFDVTTVYDLEATDKVTVIGVQA